MGLAERKAQDTIYLHVAHGGLVEQSRQPKPGFSEIEVQNKRNNQTVTKYIRTYDWVGGYVTKLVFSERADPQSDFVYRSFKLHLDTGAQPVVIDLDLQGRAWKRLAKMSPNIDWEKPIEVTAWFSKQNNAMAFALSQDGENVRQAFTVENPGYCPSPEKSEMDGSWDFRKQDIFLFRLLRDEMVPLIEAATAAREQAKPASHQSDSRRPTHELTDPDFDQYDERLGF